MVKVGQPATFFGTGFPGESFGFCFSQDALCHAGRQTPKALEEAARLLAPGGVFACTNILRAEDATEEELDEVLVRLQVQIYIYISGRVCLSPYDVCSRACTCLWGVLFVNVPGIYYHLYRVRTYYHIVTHTAVSGLALSHYMLLHSLLCIPIVSEGVVTYEQSACCLATKSNYIKNGDRAVVYTNSVTLEFQLLSKVCHVGYIHKYAVHTYVSSAACWTRGTFWCGVSGVVIFLE